MGNFAETKQSNQNIGAASSAAAAQQNNGGGGGGKKKKNKPSMDTGHLMVESGIYQRPKTTSYNAHLLMPDESKKMSKHAKRRANKKAK